MWVKSDFSRLLLALGVVLAGALMISGWWADARGYEFLANVLVELKGAFATLVLIDLLLPRAMRLLADVQSGPSGRLRRRMNDEAALLQAAFVFVLELQSNPSDGKGVDLFQEALEAKWARPLTQAEFEALHRAVTNNIAEAVKFVKARQA